MKKISISRFVAPGYAFSEAINTLCTNLSFSGDGVKKIMITSCHATEGKSTISMNVLRTMAKFGKRTVLVDTDLRRSMIAKRYGLVCREGELVGLTHYLAGMAQAGEIVYSTDMPNAYIVPVGKNVSNSLTLLNSPKLGRFMDQLSQTMDYVIVDAPPIGALIDAAQIAKSCDGTLIAINYNSVRARELVEAKEQLEQTGCPILGTVINQAELDSYLSRKYYYSNYYSRYDDYYKLSGDGDNKTPARKPKSGKKRR